MFTFGQTPTYQSDEKFDLGISDDKRALTLSFLEGFEVAVGGSKSPAPTATRAFFSSCRSKDTTTPRGWKSSSFAATLLLRLPREQPRP